jgi:DNA-binding GntR family transcriptional regulator
MKAKARSTPSVTADEALYQRWEGAVAFRLFAEGAAPTLSMPEQIAVAIGERIISGALEPGARILEEGVATEFAVSRGPVREAVRILEREGLVTLYPRRGVVVTNLLAEEVREIFEIRAGLLETVARKVAIARDPKLIALLRAGVARLTRLACMADDQGAYAEASYRLSILSVRACGNQRLTRMLVALSLQTLRYAKLSLASAARRHQSAALWAEALAALEAGQVATYVRLARSRVEQSGAEAARLLDAAADAAATATTQRKDYA